MFCPLVSDIDTNLQRTVLVSASEAGRTLGESLSVLPSYVRQETELFWSAGNTLYLLGSVAWIFH